VHYSSLSPAGDVHQNHLGTSKPAIVMLAHLVYIRLAHAKPSLII
jgi:hypothetical protein